MDESTADSNAYESDEEFYDDEDELIGILNYLKELYYYTNLFDRYNRRAGRR